MALADRFSRPMTINRVGSVFATYFTDRPVTDHRSLKVSDADAYHRMASALRDEGILMPLEVGRAAFLSSTHRAKDVDETLAACEKVLLSFYQEDSP